MDIAMVGGLLVRQSAAFEENRFLQLETTNHGLVLLFLKCALLILKYTKVLFFF